MNNKTEQTEDEMRPEHVFNKTDEQSAQQTCRALPFGNELDPARIGRARRFAGAEAVEEALRMLMKVARRQTQK